MNSAHHEYSLKKAVALGLSFWLLAAPVLGKSKGGPWEEHIGSAKTSMQQGDWQSAASSLQQAMADTAKFKDDDPRLGSTYYEMGQLNSRLQNYTLAKEYYERALAQQQKLLGAESLEAAASLYGIALCQQQLGDHLAAEIFLRRVDEIWRKKLGPRDPRLISILPSMAAYASMKNNMDQAENYYRQLVDIAAAGQNQEQLGTYMNLLATTLGNRGKFSEAKDYAEKAVDKLKANSDSSIAIDSASDNLMIIKSKLGEPVEEESSGISRSKRQQEDSAASKAAIAQAEAARKKAEADKLAAEKEAENARLALEKSKADAARLAQEKAEAEAARIAFEKSKAIEEAKLAQARAKAAEEARLAAAKQAQEAEATRLAAQEKAKAAQAAALAARNADAQSRIAENKTGTTQPESGNDADKPWKTDRVIKKPANNNEKGKDWGRVRYLADGKLISAEEYKALLLANEAYEAMQQEKYRLAADILNKALDVCPQLPSAHTNLGLALMRLGQNSEAIEHLRLAISLDSSRSAPWVNLASAFQGEGRLKDSVLTYKEYLRRFPEDKLAEKAQDLVKHLQEEADEQAEVERLVAGAGNAGDYFPYTTVSGTIKWVDARQPVKVHIASGRGVPGFRSEYQGIMSDAFKEWTSASGDRIKFDFVSSKENANIECIWTNDYSKVSSPSEGGEAQVSWSDDGIEHVKIVILTVDPTPDSPLTQNQVKAVCLHEIGHSIGLIGHSPKPNDIMFCSMPSSDAKVTLSSRDIGTIKHLYASDVQIALKPGKTQIAGKGGGQDTLASQAYVQAIEKLEAELQKHPDDEKTKESLTRAYNKYALDLAAKGKEAEAETLMDKAVKLQNSLKDAALKIFTLSNYAEILHKFRKDSQASKLELQLKQLRSKEASN